MWTRFRRYRFAAPLIALTAFLGLAASCNNSATATEESKPIVLCTIFSYFDAARAIGANTVDARILIPPNESPHEYELSTNDKFVAAKCKLFIDNGMGLDDRFEKALEGSNATVLTISKEIPPETFLKTAEIPLEGPATGPVAAEPIAVTNPHIWLDPEVQIKAAEKIRDALEKLDPKNKSVYELNASAYIHDLRTLDVEFITAVKNFKTKEFIGFHSAYDYLARRYGLKQIASLEEVPGSGLSVDQAEKIVKLIQSKNIKYVAIETALEPKGLDLIKSQTGVGVITLQPLETYTDVNDTYCSLMRQNLEALKKALD